EMILQLDFVRIVEALRALENPLVAVDFLQHGALHLHALFQAEAEMEAGAFRDAIERISAQVGAGAEEIDGSRQERKGRGVAQVRDAKDEGELLGHRAPGERRRELRRSNEDSRRLAIAGD